MPSRKQRKRREKSLRHEWEYVEIDPETGEERPFAPAALKAAKPERKDRKPAQSGRKQQGKRGSARRAPQPPSWRKVWKRTGLFAPLMAFFIYWTQKSSNGGTHPLAIVLNTAILIAFFAPFSYLVDTMTYRIYAKRAKR